MKYVSSKPCYATMTTIIPVTLITIIFIVLYFTIMKAEEYVFGDEEIERERLTDVERIIYKISCTRRFIPGNCMEPVASVWTYHFQYQNCSERLGCPSVLRSNRFQSYRACMRHCQPLADLYLQIISYDNQSIGNSSNFRKMVQEEETADTRLHNNYDFVDNIDASENIAEIEAFYKDRNKNSKEYEENVGIFPPNIDYVDNEDESTLEDLSYEE